VQQQRRDGLMCRSELSSSATAGVSLLRIRYLLILLFLLPASLIVQSPDWQHAEIGRSHLLQRLSKVRPSATQMRIAIQYLSTHPTGGSDECLEGAGNIPPTFAAMLLGQRPLVLITAMAIAAARPATNRAGC